MTFAAHSLPCWGPPWSCSSLSKCLLKGHQVAGWVAQGRRDCHLLGPEQSHCRYSKFSIMIMTYLYKTHTSTRMPTPTSKFREKGEKISQSSSFLLHWFLWGLPPPLSHQGQDYRSPPFYRVPYTSAPFCTSVLAMAASQTFHCKGKL